MENTTYTNSVAPPVMASRSERKLETGHRFRFYFVVNCIAAQLAIAMASGAPPMAGLFAAIIGGLIVSQLSGSHVTINGPAAGLIVVILGVVESLAVE